MEFWLSNCRPNCPTNKLTITFKKEYDVVEICLFSPFGQKKHKAPTIEFILNGQESYTEESDLEERIEYISEDISDLEYLTDIALLENGADCSATSQVTNLFRCQLALDLISGIQEANQEWSADCSGNNCIGQYINISFKIYGNPVRYCFMNRLWSIKYITKVKVKWTSGLEKFINLEKNTHQQCFEYSNGYIETGIHVEVVEIASSQNIGFSSVQVFIKGICQPFCIYSSHREIYVKK
ncbi:DgyrCDS14556 [Dimorphilus gyrociliatus]|uniref:DgyrCDS14556 n=1 Tax=Dimorphilus gyrociliatus TaxID=2664684 RepID=A0A7I8WE00_9ANNE|nr:DgyrCDS14556 [Dimorphilus gyrociliatus]